MPEFVDIAIAHSVDEIPELAQDMFGQNRPIFQVSEEVVGAVGVRPVVECIETAVQANLDPGFVFNISAPTPDTATNLGPHYHSAIEGGVSLHRNLNGEAVVKAAFRGSYRDPRINELEFDGDELIVGTPLEELVGLMGPVHIGNLATNRITVIAEATMSPPTRRHWYSRRSAPTQVLQSAVHDFIRPEGPRQFVLLASSKLSTVRSKVAVNAFCE